MELHAEPITLKLPCKLPRYNNDVRDDLPWSSPDAYREARLRARICNPASFALGQRLAWRARCPRFLMQREPLLKGCFGQAPIGACPVF